jgi:hypothetical protein
MKKIIALSQRHGDWGGAVATRWDITAPRDGVTG